MGTQKGLVPGSPTGPWMVLKLFTSNWDLNPCTGTHTQPKPCLGFEPTRLGLNPAKTHSTWFQDLMKLRFLMSHHRENTLKDKVIGKKWIYSDSERSTLHRQSVDHPWGRVWPWNMTCLVFIGWVISHANEWEDYSNYFWEGVEISRNWATTNSLVFWQCLKTVIVPLCSVTQLCPTLCCQESV